MIALLLEGSGAQLSITTIIVLIAAAIIIISLLGRCVNIEKVSDKVVNWDKIVEIIRNAIISVENSGVSKSDAKKQAALDIIQAECTKLNLPIDLEKISSYIEKIVAEYNSFIGKK